MRSPIVAVLVCLLSTSTARAQDPAPPPVASASGEAARLTIAMSGVVVVGAGFSMMLYAHNRPGDPEPGLFIGGVVVVAAGVTMTWLGLRSHTVIVVPTVSPQRVGAIALIQWGDAKRARQHR